MNRKNGLLAFLCTFIAVGAVAMQVPFVSAIGHLSSSAEGIFLPVRSSLLAKTFTPPTAAQIPTDPAKKPVVTLFEIQRERKADRKIHELSQQNHIPFAVLKAYLALWSKGEVDENGFFWATAPGKDNVSAYVDKEEDGLQSTVSMANHLGKLARLTSTYLAAIVAPEIGVLRAARVAKFANKSPDSFLYAMNLLLPAHLRDESEKKLCTVMGLAAAMEAGWPVEDPDMEMIQGPGVRLSSSPGEKILAPMAGMVTFAGTNDGGVCVEINTVCDMYVTICDMKSSALTHGQYVTKATIIGISGSRRPIYNVWLGAYAIDSSQFIKPSPPPQKPDSPGTPASPPSVTTPEKSQHPLHQGDSAP